MDGKVETGRTNIVSSEAARPTLKTIAFMTGLGVTTVSRALKDAPDIGEETKKRVQLVARQVGYRPNRAGVRLRTGKTNVISLILNTDEQLLSFISDIIYGLTEELVDTPYHLILTPYSSRNDAMDPVRYVVETQSADGVIISQTEPNDARVRYMAEHGFPFATHGRTQGGIEHAWHDYDNAAFARAAVRKLAERGRQRLALLPPPPSYTYHRHTRDGFSEGLSEAGLQEVAFSDTWIDQPIERIRERALALVRGPRAPDGIVSSSGTGAFALAAAIEDAGLRLGRDIDIVTKQSSKLVQMFRRELMVVNEDFRLAGRELGRAVIRSIGGADPRSLQTLAAPPDIEGPFP